MKFGLPSFLSREAAEIEKKNHSESLGPGGQDEYNDNEEAGLELADEESAEVGSQEVIRWPTDMPEQTKGAVLKYLRHERKEYEASTEDPVLLYKSIVFGKFIDDGGRIFLSALAKELEEKFNGIDKGAFDQACKDLEKILAKDWESLTGGTGQAEGLGGFGREKKVSAKKQSLTEDGGQYQFAESGRESGAEQAENENQDVIKWPADKTKNNIKSTDTMLRNKVAEYKKRLDDPEWQAHPIDSKYKIRLFQKFLDNEGWVNTAEVARQIEREEGSIDQEAFDEVCGILKNYITEGDEGLTGGTGLAGGKGRLALEKKTTRKNLNKESR
jgi:hypothetical protein